MNTTQRVEILSLSQHEWNLPYWTSRQFLTHELSRYARVVYGTRRTYVRRFFAVEHWVQRLARPPYPAPPNLTVVPPPLRFPQIYGHKRIDSFLARRWVALLNRSLSHAPGVRRVAYVWEPDLVQYVPELDVESVVYHPYDKFTEMGPNPGVVRERERRLCSMAKAVITPHRRVAESLGHPNSHVINNGVFLPAFSGVSEHEMPATMSHLSGPRIGYVGTLNDKIDFEILHAVFRKRTDWNLIIVGPAGRGAWRQSSGYRGCKELGNVHFLPAVPINRIAGIMAAFNVGIIPYKLSGWAGFSESPLKLYQYWASRIPVIATPLPNMKTRPGFLSIARDPEAWEVAIAWELKHDSETVRARRRALAEENSWTEIAKKVYQIILRTLEPETPR